MPIEFNVLDYARVEVSLFANWGHMADQALFGCGLLICGLVGLAVQCALIVVAVRRRRNIQRILTSDDPSLDLVHRSYSVWPEVVSACLLALPLIIEGVSLYVRVETVAAALQPVDPSQKATLLSVGSKERYYGPVLASIMMAIQAVPAALMIAVGTFYRLKLHGVLTFLGLDEKGAVQQQPSGNVAEAYRKYPCPSRKFFLVLGIAAGGALAAFWITTASFAAYLIEAFSGAAVVHPDQKLEKDDIPRKARFGLRVSSDTQYGVLARAVVAGRQLGNQVLVAVGEARATWPAD